MKEEQQRYFSVRVGKASAVNDASGLSVENCFVQLSSFIVAAQFESHSVACQQ